MTFQAATLKTLLKTNDSWFLWLKKIRLNYHNEIDYLDCNRVLLHTHQTAPYQFHILWLCLLDGACENTDSVTFFVIPTYSAVGVSIHDLNFIRSILFPWIRTERHLVLIAIDNKTILPTVFRCARSSRHCIPVVPVCSNVLPSILWYTPEGSHQHHWDHQSSFRKPWI